jgi:hypothetical protein
MPGVYSVFWKAGVLVSLVFAPLCAQNPPAKLSNIAVLDFSGDATTTAEQLQFISGKMATELLATGDFTVLERGRMDMILKEQGFQQSGACSSSECQVEMGQMLGVDQLVGGSLVRFGPTYMVRVDLLDVGTGRILRSVDLQKKGELYEIVNELCREVVVKLTAKQAQVEAPVQKPEAPITPKVVPADALPRAEKKPMSGMRKGALVSLGTSLLLGGTGFYFNQQGVAYMDDYDAASNGQDEAKLRDSYDNANDMRTYRNASYGVSLGLVALAVTLWIMGE